MGPGVGICFTAEVALVRGQPVILGSAYGKVTELVGSDSELVIGFALNDAAIGQEVAIHQVTNGATKCKVLAGDDINRGDVITTLDGDIVALTPGVSLQYVCGVALEDAADGQLFDVLPCFSAQVGAGA